MQRVVSRHQRPDRTRGRRGHHGIRVPANPPRTLIDCDPVPPRQQPGAGHAGDPRPNDGDVQAGSSRLSPNMRAADGLHHRRCSPRRLIIRNGGYGMPVSPEHAVYQPVRGLDHLAASGDPNLWAVRKKGQWMRSITSDLTTEPVRAQPVRSPRSCHGRRRR